MLLQFDGLWSGLGEVADKVMNQLGVGGIILHKQKRYLSAQYEDKFLLSMGNNILEI